MLHFIRLPYFNVPIQDAIQFKVLSIVEQSTDYTKTNSLEYYAKYGILKVVKYLVSMGADIHSDNEYAIRYASRDGHLAVVKYLVSVGADINASHGYAIR